MVQRGNGSGKVHRLADSDVTVEKKAMGAVGCIVGLCFALLGAVAYFCFVMLTGWAALSSAATFGWVSPDWTWTQQFATGLVLSLVCGVLARRAR